MAAGLCKLDVRSAMDRLIAKGVNPSVDSIRIELGNTGSKSTIHKYLKEIKDENPNLGSKKVMVSDAILNLVNQLAAQLDDEKNEAILKIQIQSDEESFQFKQTISSLTTQMDELTEKLHQTELAAKEEALHRADAEEKLRDEHHQRNLLANEVSNLQNSLSTEKEHTQSLKKMLQQNQDSFEHFQTSAKEQRDQERARHESVLHQLQGENLHWRQKFDLSQAELIKLNQENSRILTELSLARSDLSIAMGYQEKYEETSKKLQLIEDLLEKNAASLEESTQQLSHTMKEVDSLKLNILDRDLKIVELTAIQNARGKILDELQSTFCPITPSST